jgi:putative Mg2+ transporter-C (MgtC) family protein
METISLFDTSMTFFHADLVIRAAYALFVGFVMGFEREYHAKPAGVKTYAMICLGATIITYMSLNLSDNADASRLAAQIVSGLGFIGAGAIFQSKRMITGLTTASTLWLVGSFGILIGAGMFLDTLICLAFVYVYFIVTRWVQKTKIKRSKYNLIIKMKTKTCVNKVNQTISASKIQVISKSFIASNELQFEINYISTKASNDRLLESLILLSGISAVAQ